MKHSVEYIRTLQRILSDYDDFAAGAERPGGDSGPLAAAYDTSSPATPTSCSSPLLYPGETESGYGSPPLYHGAAASAISPAGTPVNLSPADNCREDNFHRHQRLSPDGHSLPLSLSPNITSSNSSMLHHRLSPGNHGGVSGSHQRLSFLGDSNDGNLNLNRLSPVYNCGGDSGSLNARLAPGGGESLPLPPQQRPRPDSPPQSKGGSGINFFPGVVPFAKQYSWQVGCRYSASFFYI